MATQHLDRKKTTDTLSMRARSLQSSSVATTAVTLKVANSSELEIVSKDSFVRLHEP